MAYPNYINKHLEEALFTPEDFVKLSKKDMKQFPKKIIILFQRTVEAYVKRKIKPRKLKKSSAITCYVKNGIGIVRMNGIGAPHAVTAFEELVTSGGKEFVIIGTAGGLQKLGIFLCEGAIRDEGTSSHYLAHEKYAYPDLKFTKLLEDYLISKKLEFKRGTTWTIDAPYRETRKEVEHYRKEGVKTVEMEASALFSVAKLRKVKIAALFSVSDLLVGGKWDPQFDRRHLKLKLNRSVDAVYEFLKKR